MKHIEVSISGTATHTCPGCKISTRYTGVLYFSNLQAKRLVRISVRSCPVCNLPVIPLGQEKE